VPGQRSVVLGEFCCVLRLGLRAVLADRNWLVVAEGERGDGLVDAVARGADAVLLDLDAPESADDARRLLTRRPELPVVGCSAARPALKVFGDGSGAERRLDPATLMSAIAPAPR
jgi:DNA-binding NarL/FixJ family response regulator